MILTSMLTYAQAFEEISCDTYYSERAYFGTAQRPIVIQNKTDRWIKLTYKNGEQKEFDIIPLIAPGESKNNYAFNNATLSIKDIRSGACIKAMRLNPDDASDITIDVSEGKTLKEISRQDPATGQSILKIDCEYIQEEFKALGGRGTLSISNKTEGPMAIHRVTSKVGKVGRPLLVIPPSGSQNLFYAIGGRFMLKDKMGQCVGVYEVLGDAEFAIDKKELAKEGVAPFVWEANAKTAPIATLPGSFTEVKLTNGPKTTKSSENALKLSGKGDYLLTDIKKIPSEFTMEFVLNVAAKNANSPREYLVYKGDDLQDKSKVGDLMVYLQRNEQNYFTIVGEVSLIGTYTVPATAISDAKKIKDTKVFWAVNAGLLKVNKFYHIAFSCDREYMRIYINGALMNEVELPEGTYQTDENVPLVIGGSPKDGMESNAIIDEFRIWDRAFNTPVIQKRRNQSMTGKEPGLLSYLDFNIPPSQKQHTNRVTDQVTGQEIGSLINFKFDELSNWIDASSDDWKTIGYGEVPKESLALWLKADSGVNVIENRVSSWQDLSGNGWHANQKHWKYAPVFLDKGLNNKPALYFARSYLKTDGSFLVGKDYTVFVVHHRLVPTQNNFVLTGGEPSLPNQGLGLGFNMNSASFGHGENKLEAEAFGHHVNNASLMTFRQSTADGRKIFVNDELIGSGASQQDKQSLIALRHLGIGGYKTSNSFFSGPIAEILIYDRPLDQEEITAIQESLIGKYGIGQSFANKLLDTELLVAEEPNNYQPVLMDLPVQNSPIQKVQKVQGEPNPTLKQSLVQAGIDISDRGMKLWLKADEGVETSSLDARSQRSIDQGMIEPWSGTVNYVDRWIDQSGSGNDALAVKGLSHFRPALIDDGSSQHLKFGLKRMKRTAAGENELQYMIGQKLKAPTKFLNHSSYTIFVVYRPSDEIPEGHFSGSFLSNQTVDSKDPQTGRTLSGSRLIYGYTQKSQSAETNELMLIQDRSEQMLGKNRFNTVTRKLPMEHFQKQILTVRLDTLVGTDYWVSGQKLFETFGHSDPMDGLDSLLIGTGPSSAFSGDIYEIIMYNNALTDEEVGKVQQYLISKYDVESLPLGLGDVFKYHGLNSFNAVSKKETIRATTFYVDFPDYPGSETFPETPVDSLQAFYDRWAGGKIHFEPTVYEKTWKRHASAAPEPNGIKVPNGSKIQKTFMDQSPDFDFSQYNVTHTIYPKVPDYERANVNNYGKFADRNKLAPNISLGNRVHDDPNYHKTMIHEYGHIFGLPDLYYEDDDGVGPEIVNTQATGSWSLMADAFGSKNLLLWELFYLGWLPEDRMNFIKKDVWEGEVLQHETGSGTWLLIIPADPLAVYHVSFYCIEVPQKPNPENTEGVLVYFVDTKKKTSLLPVEVMKKRLSETWEAPLQPGEELSLDQMPFSVKVLSKTDQGYRVKITRK